MNLELNFRDKVAIISGAASGLGLLSAQLLAESGAKVVMTDINNDTLTAAADDICKKGGEATGVVVDVRDYNQVQHAADVAIEKYGTIDIMINCAGGAEGRMMKCSAPFHEMPIEVIDWGLDVNLKGAVYFSRAVLGTMIAKANGVIINLSSVTGTEGGGNGSVCYGAAKSGILGLTKSLAICGAPHNVRACSVAPGPVLTRPGMANMKTRLGRAAEPVEVVDLILYLCSDKAAFITGSNHMIDGGRSCGGFQ